MFGGLPLTELDFLLAASMPRGDGQFLSLYKLLTVIVLFFIWIAICDWVNEDAQALRLGASKWNCLVYLIGLGGMAFPFVQPNFVLVFIVTSLSIGSPVLTYIFVVRNPSVPDRRKVLTAEHLQGLMTRIAAKIGVTLRFRRGVEEQEGPNVRFYGKTSTGRTDKGRSANAESSRGFGGAKELVFDAVIHRATDIHMEPTEDEMSVRYRIDGLLHNSEPFDRDTGEAILNVFKVLGAMDITEKRKPQDGSFGAEINKDRHEFRVATSGSANGEKMVLRILDSNTENIRLDRLGMTKKLIERVQEISLQPHGMFLCCGPTGAGKSTTLYACLQEIDRMTRNVITVEDPIEYRIDAVTQIEINTKAGQTFASSLRSILRQDPDVILIGEIRDKETATIACQAAQTGHMVFSTVHSNDSIATIFRLLDLDVDAGNLGTALSAVLAQRLVRLLCDKCKRPYQPTPEELAKLKLGAKVQTLYKPNKQPCDYCSGVGYRGRTGVYELLTVTEAMRDMIREKKSLREFKAEAVKSGTEMLLVNGLRLVARGKTSVAELLRVVK